MRFQCQGSVLQNISQSLRVSMFSLLSAYCACCV